MALGNPFSRWRKSPETEAGNGSEPKKPKKQRNAILELILTLVGAIVFIFLLQAFVVKPYTIPSGSMEPTLKIGQRVIVDRIGFSPHVGQIVVFHPPKEADPHPVCGPSRVSIQPGGAACDANFPEEETGVNFIKRVVAGPGDEIYISKGHVYRKAAGTSSFVRESDSYIAPCESGIEGGEVDVSECNFPKAIKIPAGHWFMMGDNRGNSDDSRFWGPVPTSWMIGDAFFTYWPLDRVGTL